MFPFKMRPLTTNATHAPDPRPALGYALGLIGVVIFSGTLPATRFAVETFDPWFITFGRAALATAFAMATLTLLRRQLPRKHVPALLLAGLLLVYGFPGFMGLAMLTVPSSHGGVVLGILPLATAVFATLWAGERPSPLFWLCAIIGSVLIIIFALLDGAWGFAIGDLWLLFAGLAASAGYVISGKLSRNMPGWEVICWALVLTAPASFLATFLTWEPAYRDASASALWAFVYLGLGSMFLGFFAWNAGLALGGMARVGQLQLFQTFFTVALGAWLLGETVTLETWGFAFAILVVVLLGRKARVG